MQISQIINELYQSKVIDNPREQLEGDFIKFAKQVQNGFVHHTLDLQKLQFGLTVLSRIPRLMRIVPGITRLNFYGNLIKDSGLPKVFQLLELNLQVKYLDLGANDLCDDSMIAMLDIVRNVPLKSLQLGSYDDMYQPNRFTRESLEAIMAEICISNQLECFGIGGIGSIKQKKTQKAKKFSKHLSKLLVTCDKLRTLNISKCNLVDSDQSILAAGFSENKNLKYLDIHDNYFPSGTRLVDGITNLDKLIYLNLSHCSLCEAACHSLSKKLGEGWTLISLNISNNEQIGTEGINELISVLSSNIYLVSLNISTTGFDERVNVQLGKLFENNCILQELDLSSNDLGDSFTESFSSLTLHSLSLTTCRISDQGAINLAKILTNNKTLKKLSLKNNFLTKASGYDLVKLFQQNETLTAIDLSSSQIDCFASEAIRTICTRNKTTHHTNKLDKLRKEYVHLSIQDSKIPGVSNHLKELCDEHVQLDEEIESLQGRIELHDSSTSISIKNVKKEIEELNKAIEAQEEQISEMQTKITEMNQESEISLKRYELDSQREQREFDKFEQDAEKVEKETAEFIKESVQLQQKLNQQIIMVDEMLGEVLRTTRVKKKLREYQIPVYPFEEEEMAEQARQEELSNEEKAARLAEELALLDESYGFYNFKEEEEKEEDKNKKKGKKKAKKDQHKSARSTKSKKKKEPE